MKKIFKVLSNSAEDGVKARLSESDTESSQIETPVFMPVGTLGNVKALEQRELI
ncbi:MAG: hypothetical protein IPM96_19760 [Ignavibacteria bacterium]|nr:hypothetical protein [Ignavibacteria bacterium]